MFLTISGRVLCLLDLLVARLEQPPGLEKIVLQSREFFPEEKGFCTCLGFRSRFWRPISWSVQKRFPKTRSLLSLEQLQPTSSWVCPVRSKSCAERWVGSGV